MKILALNATYRPKQTTTRLTQKALEGAASVGAETEMTLLRDHDILSAQLVLPVTKICKRGT